MARFMCVSTPHEADSPAAMLRESGWDAVHVREIGVRDAEDSAILEYAASDARVVITLDRDSLSCWP